MIKLILLLALFCLNVFAQPAIPFPPMRNAPSNCSVGQYFLDVSANTPVLRQCNGANTWVGIYSGSNGSITPGITCDGKTDMTTAIATATATGATVVFPAGTCLVSTEALATGQSWKGQGQQYTKIQITGTPTCGVCITGNNVAITGLTVDANQKATYAIQAATSLSTITIVDVGAINGTGSGFQFLSDSNLLVSQCTATGNGTTQFNFQTAAGATSSNVIVEKCIFDPLSAGSTFVTLYAMQALAGSASSQTGLIVRDNFVKYYSRSATETDGIVVNESATNAGVAVQIYGNTIISDAVASTGSNALEIQGAGVDVFGNYISGNYFDINVHSATNQATNIYGNYLGCAASTCTGGGMIQTSAGGGSITGNYLQSSTHSYGILIGSANWTVTGNTLDCSSCAVVYIQAGSTDTIVSDNNFKNCTQGILMSGALSKITIANNRFTGGCFYGFYNGAASSSDVVLRGNSYNGSTVPFTTQNQAGLYIYDEPTWLPAPAITLTSCGSAATSGTPTNATGVITGTPGGTCTVTITPTSHARTLWYCTISNTTHPGTTNSLWPSSISATAVTLTGTTQAGDQLVYNCTQS